MAYALRLAFYFNLRKTYAWAFLNIRPIFILILGRRHGTEHAGRGPFKRASS